MVQICQAPQSPLRNLQIHQLQRIKVFALFVPGCRSPCPTFCVNLMKNELMLSSKIKSLAHFFCLQFPKIL